MTHNATYLCATAGDLVDVRIGDVNATQASLGYDEVYYKLGRYPVGKESINKKYDDWCEANGQMAATVWATAKLKDPTSCTCTLPIGQETPASIALMKTVVIGVFLVCPDRAVQSRRSGVIPQRAKSVRFDRAASAAAGAGHMVLATTTVRPICSFQYAVSSYPKMRPPWPQFAPQVSWTRSMPKPYRNWFGSVGSSGTVVSISRSMDGVSSLPAIRAW
jgi:Putative ParB-like nuclease